MSRIKTKAYLGVTLEQAREWYESGNEDLKNLALNAFSEEMLIPSFKEIVGVVIGIILLGISLFMLLTGRGKLSKNDEDAGGWTSVVGGAVFFISSMICIFG